ncbi:hypothetical protein G7Y89_g4138 [Cudoniella acicularis]|uniref:Heterokaryon incompatibility domain-containing protein n=1 Tax=Cudoniella acicularis TaxID=354080 RepID=A0A8H4W7R1_9HELO|nr:hypothetical protein G7Y89_g4138 [Cudoniella acicularis]
MSSFQEMAQNITSFKYTPLKTDENEIRLVVLLPPNDSEEIVCRIIHKHMTDDDVTYEALSYVWGSSEDIHSIQLMGSVEEPESVTKHNFPVTKNLHEALCLLRRPESCRVLWIDAICINQSDDAERSSQVALMRSIYSNAFHAVVYFGPEDEFSKPGIDFLTRVATTIAPDQLPEAGVWQASKNIEEHPMREVLKEPKALEVAVAFLSRPWWSRVWIAQEITVAKKATLLWGKQTLIWEACARTIHILHNYIGHLRETPEFEQSEAWLKIDDYMFWTMAVIQTSEAYRRNLKSPLMDILQRFWFSEATDSRDKVFALLGIASDTGPDSLIPDYSLLQGQVYGMIVKDLIKRANNLDILALCSGPGVRRVEGLPTWAPDWTVQGKKVKLEKGYHTFPFFTMYSKQSSIWGSSGGSPRKLCASRTESVDSVRFSEDSREMYLKGVCVDTIKELSEVRSCRFMRYSAFEDWGKLGDKLSHYPTGEHVPEAFARTLCANQFEFFEGLLLGDLDDYSTCQATVTSGRKFMLTKNGLMGLAVIEAEEGDVICVIEGSRMPIVLRKEDDHYLMITYRANKFLNLMSGNKAPKQAEPQSQESRKRKSRPSDSDDFIQGSGEKDRSPRSPWNCHQTQHSTIFQDDIHRSGDLPSSIDLCQRYRAIDLSKIYSLSLGDSECIPIQNLGRITDEERDSSCRLCRLLWNLRPGDSDLERSIDKDRGQPDRWLTYVSWAKVEQNGAGPRIDGFALAVLPSKPTWESESWKLGYNHRHHVLSTGYIGQPLEGNSMSSKFHVRSVKPTSIDYSIIKKWLRFCHSYHQEFCMPINSGLGNYFRLIHCETRRIVPITMSTSPVPHFLALSYVWGDKVDQEQDKAPRDYLPKGRPPTIEDSITVTLELGFDYLWIDRYCIWQDDDEDKHAQIRLMSQIYGSAQATIIAAAGSDPKYGLPGVGKRSRIPQPKVKIGPRALCWTMETSKSLLQNSVWITHAWTFQEALLSASIDIHRQTGLF